MTKNWFWWFLGFAGLFALAALFVPDANSQQGGPFLITSNQCAPIQTEQKGTVYFQVVGAWTGTLQPQGAVDGQPAFNVQVTPANSSTPQSTVTANNGYWATVAGYTTFQVCGATVGSGTAKVYLNASKKSH